MSAFAFKLEGRDGEARVGRVETAHGTIRTPAFMPVGTAATVKGLTPEMVASTGADILLANTYHLMLRPGAERVARLGGLHRFMNWQKPILTDSGGYQVMSLSKLRELDEEGVTFRAHTDGARHHLTPERAVEIQHLLGSTITMVLDECTAYPATHEEAETSMQLSMRWAKRSKAAFRAREGYGLFGIVQGGIYADLRAASAAALHEIGFEGYAIGGLAVGEGQEQMLGVLDGLMPHMPANAPRYLMGVGTPDDIIEAVARGVDMFDCVIPTRSGRTGRAYTARGAVNIRNARHAEDPRALDETCTCATCGDFSRAYLHHLFRCDEMLGPILLTRHNVHYYQSLMSDVRAAIAGGTFEDLKAAFKVTQAAGDITPPTDGV
jgi:queuine tRNA-ribosyltransferase